MMGGGNGAALEPNQGVRPSLVYVVAGRPQRRERDGRCRADHRRRNSLGNSLGRLGWGSYRRRVDELLACLEKSRVLCMRVELWVVLLIPA